MTTIVSMDSGPAPYGASRNDETRERGLPLPDVARLRLARFTAFREQVLPVERSRQSGLRDGYTGNAFQPRPLRLRRTRTKL